VRTTRTRRTTVAAVLVAVTGLTGLAGTAGAASPPLSDPTITARFDLGAGQLPENLVLDRRGSIAVTFAGSRQVARVAPDGTTTVLATLPAPSAEDGARTPVLGFPLATGLVRAPGGTLYALYAAGTEGLTGLWRVVPGAAPELVAELPAEGLPNGMALSTGAKHVYVADSVLGVVHRVRLADGRVSTWADDPALDATGFLGANGVEVHRGAVWVSNLDQGTVVRIPVEGGRAGDAEVVADGLVGIDDFAFTGRGDTLLAALNQPNTVELVTPGRGSRTVLTAADGLQGPTAVAVDGRTVHVTSAAYNTQRDPNLLTARLDRH
jgi:sugar lactone lactonase YvrE